MRKLKLFLDAKAANTPPRGISKASRVIFSVLTLLFLSIGQVWGTEKNGDLSSGSYPTGWSGSDTWKSASSYFLLTASTSYVQTDEFCQNGFSSISVTARKYGGPSTGQEVITVSWKEKGGSETVLGTITPTSTSLTSYSISNPATVTGNKEGFIKISASSTAASGKGAGVSAVTINYTAGTCGSSCTSEITITKADNPANGTFTLDKNGKVCIDEGNATVNVTATPADHYHLATVTSTVGTVGTISGNTCQITGINANTEIGVTFAEDTKYQVTWNVNGNEDTKTNVYAGEKPVFPATPDACDATSTTFIGWATAPWTGKLETLAGKSVYTSASAMPDVDAAVTYYAVFAKSSGSASNLFSWAGGTKAELTAAEGVAALNADNSDYADSHAPYRVKWNGDGKYIIISVASQPGKVSAGFKMIGGATTSTITVQEADDAEGPFTDVENLAISGSSNDVVNIESTQAFKSTTRAIKLYYTKGSNVGLGPISIEGAVTYEDYMTTCAAPTCENLGKPSVTVTNKTYNSARLTWADVAHADKYLVKFNGVDQAATSNTYFDATDLDAATTYTYQVKALAEEGQDDWCDGEFTTEANFTTESAPAATLTLSEIGETHNFAGDHTVGETVTLPLSATECSKTFVGWDPASNCTSAPTYAPGASYTLAATTQTLYAVYANPVGAVTYVKTALASIPSGSEVVVTELYSETIYAAANDGGTSAGPAAVEVTETTNVLNVGSNTNIFWILTKDGDNFSLIVKGGTDKLYCTDTNDGVRVGSGENNVFSINNAYLYNNATSRYIGKNHGSGAQTFRCYTSINTNINGETLAFYKKNVNYEDYSTTCAAALAAPTFSVDPADGPFETEISVELDAAEGTIYYTLNGTDPTNESTEYIDPIVLNTCGNKTIKAIAISSTNHSAVASATYVLNIPVPTNSQVAPYSPTEAREVIASGCYDGTTIMYVKGVVKSTTEYSSTYGNYDIVVRNIGNESSETFTYYHMYKASGNTKFTADENIEEGDTILAAGQLTLYGSTYEFANNTCYMVEHTKIASKTHIANDEAGAYTVEEAKAFCNAPTTYDLTDEVYVKGVAYGAPNNQGTFNIHDANSDNTFQIYKGSLSDALETLGVEIEANDTIVAKGTIQYYNSTTYQMNNGGEVVTVKKYVAPVIAVTGVELDETTITLKEGLSTTLVATVNPTEASNKNVTWESSNPAVATVDNGAVTAVAIGTATITVTTEDGGLSATCTVKVIDPSARELPNAAFKKVTSTSQITDGKYLIVYAAAGIDTVAFDGALTTLDAVGNTIDVTIDGDYIVAPGDAAFTIDVTNHTLKSYSGKYIGRTANSNGMNQADDATLTNTFAIDGDGNAVITSSGNPTLRYNKASDQIRFRYYKTGQQNIQLYKMVEPEEIRGNLNDGKWGTICPAKKVLVPTGASFYKLNYMELNPDGSPYKFFFDEIGENAYLEAGKPYLFIAEGTTITGVKVGDAADDGLHVHNGFVGYIGTSNYDLSSDNDVYTEGANNYYGLQNNIFKLIYGTSSYMINERAFVQITPSSKPATTEQPAPKYSRRRLVVGAGAPQVTTGTENIEASETPVKVMIDGQLFILRGEKMYDATGRLVK